MTRMVVLQLPWILVVGCVAATSGLSSNGYVHLLGALVLVAYAGMLLADFRGVAQLPPWRRAATGRLTGMVILVMGVLLCVGALVSILHPS